MINVNKKLVLNIHIYFFIIIASIAILNDNIIYFLNFDYDISLVISFIIILLFNIFFIKMRTIEIRMDFNKWDLIAIIPYCIIYFVIIQHIDDFIDTISYHLYNQKNPFIDKINYDLLPRSTTFFPLGDRMNYIFVRFLGYRFGNILYLYSVLTIFYQIKRILKVIIPNIKNKRQTLFASIIIYTFSMNLCIGEFSVDILSVVFLLELLYISLSKIDIWENKKYIFLTCLLIGILIGIKISNTFFSGIFLVYIFLKNYKSFKKLELYDICICIILMIIPFVVYMINNYVQTQNPIFPFGNSFFHSIYYEECSARDGRLGPKNILEILLWPIIIVLEPIKGDDIRGIVDPIWAIGYIILIYCLIDNKKNKKVSNLLILSLIITYIWIIFVSGYVRYAMFIAIIYYLIEIYALRKLIMEFKVETKSILKISLNYILIFLILIQIILSALIGGIYIFEKIRTSIYDFHYNLEENTISGEYDIEGVWIASRYNTSCIDLIRTDDVPMYNVDVIVDVDPMMNIRNNYSNFSSNLFYRKIERKKIIYSFKSKIFEFLYKNFKGRRI